MIQYRRIDTITKTVETLQFTLYHSYIFESPDWSPSKKLEEAKRLIKEWNQKTRGYYVYELIIEEENVSTNSKQHSATDKSTTKPRGNKKTSVAKT